MNDDAGEPTTAELWAIVRQQQTEIEWLREHLVPSARTDSETASGTSGMSRAAMIRTATAAAGVIAAGGLALGTVSGAEAASSPKAFSSLKVKGPKPKSGNGVDVAQAANFDIAVRAASTDGLGVVGIGFHGVRGIAENKDGVGVYGSSSSTAKNAAGAGVLGVATANPGVKGETTAGQAGVYGLSVGKGPGVLGEGNNVGVKGQSDSGHDGVLGTTDGSNDGAGVHGVTTSSSGVLGEAVSGTGVVGKGYGGVSGYAAGENGEGVYGYSASGVGGSFFSSSGVPLWLGDASGDFPSDPQGGQFWVDTDYGLWYYKDSWVQLA